MQRKEKNQKAARQSRTQAEEEDSASCDHVQTVENTTPVSRIPSPQARFLQLAHELHCVFDCLTRDLTEIIAEFLPPPRKQPDLSFCNLQWVLASFCHPDSWLFDGNKCGGFFSLSLWSWSFSGFRKRWIRNISRLETRPIFTLLHFPTPWHYMAIPGSSSSGPPMCCLCFC